MPRADRTPAVLDVQAVRSLRLRHCRERTRTHFAEGLRSVFRALDAGVGVEALVYCERLAPAFAQRRVRMARQAGVAVLRVTPEEFRSLSCAQRACGVGAVVRQHWTPLSQADPRAGLCWLAAGLLRTPGNTGTLLRTAEAAGAAGVIFLGPDTDPFDPGTVAASKGSIFGLRLVRTTHRAFAGWAARYGACVVGTSPSAAVDYTRAALRPPVVAMFGEERRGLTAQELSLCTTTVSIPMSGDADSLNVAVAAGVVLFELRRRASAVPVVSA